MSTTTLDELVESLDAQGSGLSAQLVHHSHQPGQPSVYSELETPIDAALLAALRAKGVERLWQHQARGIDLARSGRDVLLTTPTASGKSLVFQLPVLEEALHQRPGKALFLFPLKALAQDQRSKLEQWVKLLDLPPQSAIYDGDTPPKRRTAIRQEPPRVLITNPDMLHLGILGNAAAWGSFLGDLKWIVLDELHTYRGIFGTHFHHVLRRLLRLCQRHGASPSLIASSATAQNAADFAATLAGRPMEVVDVSGAPREGRHFLLLQPLMSPYTTALDLLVRCLRHDLKTIVFTKARRITELLHSWLRQKDPELSRRVANYRAGFLPRERREIERRLFEGELDGVISTSALEMGIDVGGLDACILVGYPGSMMATWQRSGRVGREGRESVTALVALPDALDQYLLSNPEQFLGSDCETLVISPQNEAIAQRHLLCAAAELPLRRQHDRAYLEQHAPLVGDLLRAFELAESEDKSEIYCIKAGPHRGVHLRGSGAIYQIESTASGHAIGTVDGVRVQRECHPGAIYLHAGRQYLVRELSPERRQVTAEPSRVEYFTTSLTEKETEILSIEDQLVRGPLEAWLGRVRVRERVVGFERRRLVSQERLGQEALELPWIEFETDALWWSAPRQLEEMLRERDEDFMGALHASEHAAISLVPTLALCDRNDLGGISIPYHPEVGTGAVFLYDGHGGGVGIAETTFRQLDTLLDRVIRLLEDCPCDSGCPGCVHSPKCGNGNRPLDKAGALALVSWLLGREVPEKKDPEKGEGAEPKSSVHFVDLTQGLEEGSHAEPRGVEEEAEGEGENTQSGGSWTADRMGRPHRIRHRRRGDLFDLEAPLPEDPPRLERARLPTPNLETAVETTRQRRSGRAPLPDPRRVDCTVLFDVETKRAADEVGGWQKLHRLGVAVAVTCSLEDNRFEVYREEDVPRLIDDLHAADLVVGFNVMRFDYPVLSGYSGEDFRRTLPTLDLFEQVQQVTGGRIGLSHLGRATLGCEKTADGLQSLEWYKEGRFDLIEEYCRHDVELLRDLYLFGRREGYVCFAPKGERVLRIPVDWI